MTQNARVRLYAGAGLCHCSALLKELDRARVEKRETMARLVARTHLETCFVATYIHRGGFEALTAVDGAFQHAVRSWLGAISSYNNQLLADTRRIKKQNRRIEKDNAHRRRRNEEHHELDPLPMLPLLPLPTRTVNELDVSPAIFDLPDGEAKPLPITEIAQRLNRLVAQAQEGDPSLEVVYDLAYRGLLTYGAHPTIAVLDSYIGDTVGNFVRLAPISRVPPMAEGITHYALILTANLAQLGLGSLGQDLPVTERILVEAGSLGEPEQ